MFHGLGFILAPNRNSPALKGGALAVCGSEELVTFLGPPWCLRGVSWKQVSKPDLKVALGGYFTSTGPKTEQTGVRL